MKLRRLTGLLLSLVLLFCTGCSQSAAPRSAPFPTAEEQALSSLPEDSAKAPSDQQAEETVSAEKNAPAPVQEASFTLCAYLPVSSMTQGAAAVAEEYAGSIAALDYLVLNTGAYWDENGALSLSDELLDAIETLQGKTALWCTVNPQGALIREGTAGQSIDTPQERQALAQEIAAFAEQYGLAGIDIDWEFPLDDEWEDFSTFLITLKDTLSRNSEPVALSLALYPEEIALSEEAIAALDRIHMMAYDQFDSKGFHSTMQAAEDAVAYFTALGASPQQLVLGIPAYGRPLDGSAQWVFYKDIDPESISGENPDLVGDISFNSAATAAQKTQYALEQNLSGVMVYQLLCDRNDQDALILACANMAENA